MTTTHDAAPPLLTIPEVADRLRVSVKTVRRRIESGELPVLRIGSGTRAPVRVDAAELHEWLHGASSAVIVATRAVPGAISRACPGRPPRTKSLHVEPRCDRPPARVRPSPDALREAAPARQLEKARQAGWPRLVLDELRFHRYFVEHRLTGSLYQRHRGELTDLVHLTAAAFFEREDGTIGFLEERPAGAPRTVTELQERRGERELRRNAPEPPRQGTRR